MVQSVSFTRRVWLAVVAVLALLGAGLPTAAHAVETVTISGTVTIPEGVDPGDLTVRAFVYVEPTISRDGWWKQQSWVEPETDGSFTMTPPESPVGQEYVVQLSSYDDRYVGGFYAGPGRQLGRTSDDGVLLTGSQSDLQLSLDKGLEMSATISVPPGFDWQKYWQSGIRPIGISAEEYAADGSGPLSRDNIYVVLGPDADGKVTIPGLRADSSYRIRVGDTDGSYKARFPPGYYRVGTDGLVADREHATLVRAGDTFHATVGWSLVLPKPNLETAPVVRGVPAVGSTLTASAGTWSPADVDVAYEWLRNGAVIPGASDSGYTVTRADAGARLAVRVTASRHDFDTRAATSAAVAVPEAGALRATKVPGVKGKARLGKTVRATAPRWDLAGVATAYQWLRAGKPIKGATAAKYKLKKADVGKRISVRATGSLAGHDDGVAVSKKKKVAKGKPKVTAKVKNVKAGKRARVVVRVKAAGLAKPRGTVIVKYGKKTIKTKLAAKRKGKITVRLPRLTKGTYRVRVTFKPKAKSKKLVTKATSKRVTLRVR